MMNQWEFDTIIAIVQSGAPALSNRLCNALAFVVNELQSLKSAKNENETENEKEDN